MSESGLEGRRPTWAEVDLDALASNFRAVRERVGAGVAVMGVVEADAYGHGAAECARRLAAADEPRRDCYTEEQLRRFREAVAAFREKGHRPDYEHTANSAATFAHPETHGNMVRPGGVLYGLWRDVLPPLAKAPRLRPVMSVRSRVVLLKRVRAGETLGYGCTFEATREMIVATVPAGYADGYARALSNRGRVIVCGALAPVAGRVAMDLTLVDATVVPGVSVAER